MKVFVAGGTGVAPNLIVRLLGEKLDHTVRSQRVSNRALGDSTSWHPRYPSVREGIPALLQPAALS
jgi:hypothetical protein